MRRLRLVLLPPLLCLALGWPAGRLAPLRREVTFLPSFAAAARVPGVQGGPQSAERAGGERREHRAADTCWQSSAVRYVVSEGSSREDVLRLAHGLTSTGQLSAASELVLAYIELRPEEPPMERGGAREHADVRLINMVLDACAQRGRMEICSPLLEALGTRRLPRSAYTYCILIKGYGRAKDSSRAASTLQAMRRAGVAPDLATYNALVDAYCRNGRMGLAESALARMDAEGIEPSVRTYNTLLRGYADLGMSVAGSGGHGRAAAHHPAHDRDWLQMRPPPSLGLPPPLRERSAAARTRRSLHQAFGVLRRMRAQLGASSPDGVTYNTLVSACARQGRTGLARRMLRGLAAPHAQAVGAPLRDLQRARSLVTETASSAGPSASDKGRRAFAGRLRDGIGSRVDSSITPYQRSRPPPDVIAYTSVMRGMLHAGYPLEEVST